MKGMIDTRCFGLTRQVVGSRLGYERVERGSKGGGSGCIGGKRGNASGCQPWKGLKSGGEGGKNEHDAVKD